MFQRYLFEEILSLFLSFIPTIIKNSYSKDDIKAFIKYCDNLSIAKITLMHKELISTNLNNTSKEFKPQLESYISYIDPLDNYTIEKYIDMQCTKYDKNNSLFIQLYTKIVTTLYKKTGILFSVPLLKYLCEKFLTTLKYTANKKITLNGYYIMKITNYYSKILLGKAVIQSLLEKILITIANPADFVEKKVLKKKGKNYNKEAMKYCLLFPLPMDSALINLPMVYPPRDWFYDENNETYMGGYLETQVISVMRGKVVGENMTEAMNITPNNKTSECLNYQQSIPFKVNTNFLNYINKNRIALTEKGLLTDIKHLVINPMQEGQRDYLKLIENSKPFENNITEKD
uniref:Putative DNA-directed RNA polymerase n=1 Tax=Bulbochaete rectangularis var. hiloensis TaxID=55990 RepID=A0A6M4SPF2_9CHLO|nr:putative DNA-directed RNA polymerase [Bulbochaete rectangularis var. hiloensis]